MGESPLGCSRIVEREACHDRRDRLSARSKYGDRCPKLPLGLATQTEGVTRNTQMGRMNAE